MSSGSRRRTNSSSGHKSKEPSTEGILQLQSFVAGIPVSSRDKHRNIFLKFLQNITGVEVDVHLNDGRIYRGVFYTATPFEGKKQEVALKAARKVDKSGQVTRDANVDIGSTVLLSFSDILRLIVPKSKISACQANADLATDTMLSRRANIAELDGRDLESVASSWLAPETSAKIDRGYTHVQGSWNQFEVNKRLYNVQDTFDENLYTKRLDKSSITREQQERADRIAHQIEKSTTGNIHLKEERGQLGDSLEIDEEDMYSGVIRQSSQDGPGASALTGNAATGSTNKGFGRGSSSASPSGAWRKMEVSGVISPTSASKQKGGSPFSSRPGSRGAPAAPATSTTTNLGAVDVDGPPPGMSSPDLPPGLSNEDSGDGGRAVVVGIGEKVSSSSSNAIASSENDKNDTPSLSTSTPVDTAPPASSTADVKKEEEKIEPAAPAPPKSTFSFNIGASEFVPSFAMKSPGVSATPASPSTPSMGGTRDGQHGSGHGNTGGTHGGGVHHGGGGGRGKGPRNKGRGGNYGGGGHHAPHFDYGGGMGYGLPAVMPGPMGYDMGNGMYPGMGPYGPGGGMPGMGYDGAFGPGGFYPSPGYFMPGQAPMMPFDSNYAGSAGMMPAPMGYEGPPGQYYGMQHGPPGGDMGGGVPVAAGLSNVAVTSPPGKAGSESGADGSDTNAA